MINKLLIYLLYFTYLLATHAHYKRTLPELHANHWPDQTVEIMVITLLYNYHNLIDWILFSGSLFIAKADTEGRREELAQRFFRRNVFDETSCLHYLLKSQERSQEIINRLRSS